MRPLTRPTGPFDVCVEFQTKSTELVVYSDLAKQMVTIAWPTFNGKRIVPTGIKNWLRARGLHWSCFCGLLSGASESTQIVQSIGDGKVYVFCSSYPPKCHFYLKLSEIYISAVLEFEYPHVPTLASDLAFSTNNLLADFLLRGADEIEVGPYFPGYCGEHIGDHPGSEQQSGSPIVVTRTGQRKTKSSLSAGAASSRMNIKSPSVAMSRASTRRSTPNPLGPSAASGCPRAGPSLEGVPTGPSTGSFTAGNALNVIRTLEAGGGISEYQANGLLEQCGACREYFLTVFFKVHVLRCDSIIIL